MYCVLVKRMLLEKVIFIIMMDQKNDLGHKLMIQDDLRMTSG